MLELPPLIDKRTGKDRFWPRVQIGKLFDCWLWSGPLTNEYGQVAFWPNRTKRAHVVAWELFNKTSVPKGWHIHHKCLNKMCCNPLHLEQKREKEHGELHNAPQICSHGNLGKAKCLDCDRERRRKARANLTPAQREEIRRIDRERKRRAA